MENLLLDDLKKVIASRQAVVIVGAGVSIGATGGAGVASWKGLLKDGVGRCIAVVPSLPDGWGQRVSDQIECGDTKELLLAAESIAERLSAPDGGEYGRWLEESVGALRADHREVLEALKDLGVPLATTNYDGLLEEVTGWDPVTWRQGPLVESVLQGHRQGVLHLHGYWKDPASVVLGVRSYESVLGSDHAQTVLRALRLMKQLVFVGCGGGLSDPNFGAFLSWTGTVFASSPCRQFRLARTDQVEEFQKQHPPQQRVYVLPYDEQDKDLAHFLRGLKPSGEPSPQPGPNIAQPGTTPRLRVTILVGHFPEEPVPEGAEMAKLAVQALMQEGLHVELRVDTASVAGLRRTAASVCDVLIYYGHGTNNGFLSFEDGLKAYTDLAAGPDLAGFWSRLQACFIFACYVDRFASQLPCPWVAFSAPILRHAPKGFFQTVASGLATRDLSTAVEEAREASRKRMKSDFSEVMRLSTKPMPHLMVGTGEPHLVRLSPQLSGKYWLDFAEIPDERFGYSAHEPFVGRVSDLRSLLRLPSAHDDQPSQRVVWVHGDAGMGKSALLQQCAIYVRDMTFRESDDPVYLLHLYCQNFTESKKILDALFARVVTLYGLSETPEPVESLCRTLASLRGTHVWILDDVTYLSVRPDSTEEAAALVTRLRDAARSNGLVLHLIVSARRTGPAIFERLLVKPLAHPDAMTLARFVLAQRGKPELDLSDVAGAYHLFELSGRNPAHYKRAITLAADRGIAFSDYARGLELVGSLPHLDATERARRMVDHEVKHLAELQATHGFAYSDFLKVYYPLVTRAGFFTLDELVSWFGERFRVEDDTRPVSVSYRNGLEYLVLINIVRVEKRDGQIVFAMPPNQRLAMQTLVDPWTALPPAVPLRGATERLSLALERIQSGDVRAVGDLLMMEDDYRPHMADPQAAAAVFYAMLIRAEIAEHTEISALPTPPQGANHGYNFDSWRHSSTL